MNAPRRSLNSANHNGQCRANCCSVYDLVADHAGWKGRSRCFGYWLDLEAEAEKDPIERILSLYSYAVEYGLNRKPMKMEIHVSPGFMCRLTAAYIRLTPVETIINLTDRSPQQQIFGMPITVTEGLAHDFEIVSVLTEDVAKKEANK